MESKTRKNEHELTEAWFNALWDMGVKPWFANFGYELPARIRITASFTSQGKKARVAGECWPPAASSDGKWEILVRNDRHDTTAVADSVFHNTIHIIAGPDHGPAFREVALRCGFEGKMREAAPGKTLQPHIDKVLDQLGPFPRGKLDWATFDMAGKLVADRPKRQTTRMHKADCQGVGCGYTVRVSAKWVTEVGPPHCPAHGAMKVTLPDESAPHAEELDIIAVGQEGQSLAAAAE